jgi:hypothetical protein
MASLHHVGACWHSCRLKNTLFQLTIVVGIECGEGSLCVLLGVKEQLKILQGERSSDQVGGASEQDMTISVLSILGCQVVVRTHARVKVQGTAALLSWRQA